MVVGVYPGLVGLFDIHVQFYCYGIRYSWIFSVAKSAVNGETVMDQVVEIPYWLLLLGVAGNTLSIILAFWLGGLYQRHYSGDYDCIDNRKVDDFQGM